MAAGCAEGQYLDRLVLKCVSCSVVCHHHMIVKRCSEYCEAWRCRSVSGQFYDTLLKKCLRCSELCGSHPSACAHTCRIAAVTQRPVGGSAVALVTGRGRAEGRSALYSEALLYALLGLCVTALMFTLTAAIVLLLKRNKHQDKKQQPNTHAQSSNDSLMARADEVSQEGSVNHDKPRATETCVYCFSERTAAPHPLHRQAGAPSPERHHHHDNGPVHELADKPGAFRIICSPTHSDTCAEDEKTGRVPVEL